MSSRCVWMLAAVSCLFLSHASCAEPVDFERDIRPILNEHCVKCHGPKRKESGLLLHELDGALAGGDSGRPVLGGTVETNELLRRVTSDDPDERMPHEAEALPAGQIDLIRRWVEQGTPWPKPATEIAGPQVDKTEAFFSRWVMPYLPWAIGLFVAVLVVERLRVVAKRRDEAGADRLGGCFAIAKRVTPPVYAAMVLCLAVGVLIHQVVRLERSLDRANAERRAAAAQADSASAFGDPPRPVRPSHPKRLGGTYYRGNSERNPALFNGGYYLTATLELSLIDGKGGKLDYGSPTDDGMKLRLLIRRAPGATPLLFSEKIMSGLLLATGYHPAGMAVAGGKAATFKPTGKPGEWVAEYPLPDSRARAGLVYLYRGDKDETGNIKTVGMPQLGIVYDLKLKDSRIARGSDLWLDAIYYPENVAPPVRPQRIPWGEWYDYRPMPAIEGENTSDPELLGIGDYIKGKEESTP